MNQSLIMIAEHAKTSTEIDARIRRWLQEGGTPSPAVIKMLRESLGLSVRQFAEALGWVGSNSDRTVLHLESGKRSGEPFLPRPPTIVALRGFAVMYLAAQALSHHDLAGAVRVLEIGLVMRAEN